MDDTHSKQGALNREDFSHFGRSGRRSRRWPPWPRWPLAKGLDFLHGQNIAVIDVGLVFDKDVRFNAQMDQLKAEIDATERRSGKKRPQDINAMSRADQGPQG